MRHSYFFGAIMLGIAGMASAQAAPPKQEFVRSTGPVAAIVHVSLVDGTGAEARQDQTVVIKDGRIAQVGPAGKIRIPKGAQVFDGHGKSLIPGLVGMHEHLFYPSPVAGHPVAIEQFYTAPLLYLASGVTTARTAGCIDPYGDLEVKRGIDAGRTIGPDLDLSTPYLEGSPPALPQMHALSGPDDARRLVEYWHGEGFTSVKAYANITPDELGAGIDEAHKLGMEVTGHLCSVGYARAMDLAMDNFEHGPFASPDGELDPERAPDMCMAAKPTTPPRSVLSRVAGDVSPDSPEVKQLIDLLVSRHVPVTSTLAVLEGGVGMSDARREQLKTLLHPAVWSFITTSSPARTGLEKLLSQSLQKEMVFERAFARAGGTLLAGCDPTGEGFTFAGLGDQRNVELLVQAGFTVPEAVRIATLNGAVFEGRDKEVGSVEAGKRADLVLLSGDVSQDVSAMEHPEVVFKAGVGYDSQAIYKSLAGHVGLH
jgi:imidazolonepropionase-like amidohydrolase